MSCKPGTACSTMRQRANATMSRLTGGGNPFGRRVQMANSGNPFGGRNVFRQNPTQGWTARAMRSPTVVPPRPVVNPNRTVTKQTTGGACCAASTAN